MTMAVFVVFCLLLSVFCCATGFLLGGGLVWKSHVQRRSRSLRSIPQPQLDSVVPEGTIGSFMDERAERNAMIQCNIVSCGNVEGKEYGVGYPVDMPVMLTYFEGNELKPVRPDYPDYDHLVQHVAVQLEDNDIHLFNTPIVLTLQGDFEDDEDNDSSPFAGSNGDGEWDNDHSSDDEIDFPSEEITLEDLLKEAEFNQDWHSDSGEDGGNTDTDLSTDSEENVHEDDQPSTATDREGNEIPDYQIHHVDNPDLSTIPFDGTVTAEDTAGLQRAHRKADRVISYAVDMKLIGSFHYKKKNFHLVRLLEPIFVMGRRLQNRKGHFYALLDEAETEQVRPVLEQQLQQQSRVSEDTTTRSRRSAKVISGGAAKDRLPDNSRGFGTGSAAQRGMQPSSQQAAGQQQQQTHMAAQDRSWTAPTPTPQAAAPAGKWRPRGERDAQFQSAKQQWQRTRRQP